MSADPSPPRSKPHWIIWLFAIVGVLGMVALIFLAVAVLNFGRMQEPAEVAGDTPEDVFTVQNAGPIEGTNFIKIEIGRGDDRGSYSSTTSELRNILLLDKRTGVSRKLLPDNSRRIVHSYFLPAEADATVTADSVMAGAPEAAAPAAYYALLVERTGEDGRLDMLVGSLADARQAFVMPGVEGVDGVWMQSATRIGLVAREGRNLYYRVIDVPSLRVVLSRRIAI